MDKPLGHLDRHFDLPHVRQVDTARPWRWLKLGWQDLSASPGASLFYGAFYALMGYLILAYAVDMPYLFTAAISGFMLIGPVAAAGLYEISRRRTKGEVCGLYESLVGLRRHGDSLFYFGLFLAVTLILWERTSVILFALFYNASAPSVGNLLGDIFLSGEHLQFVAAYLVLGGILAAVVFALSVVSVPMLMDRDTDIATAMMTSARAVALNPATTALWAAILVGAMALGFATLMVGMVLLLPLIGHASWHAYKDLVE
ncbi:DUF2189 domain-containing protein [Denitromonas iodatirespirans]|uniref:DUF2189 domain-containing protein n=1 Tax=Denitromonas iodatirespirans TaxID=2795389 RepID=A0A944H9Y8_DENI1|nr:DUF2189 domain-containing protein [Denitromonas iodatirespirans]MBT0960022.1 DUF2189 domain-containing protein [Denitromonas iodatirespirans]